MLVVIREQEITTSVRVTEASYGLKLDVVCVIVDDTGQKVIQVFFFFVFLLKFKTQTKLCQAMNHTAINPGNMELNTTKKKYKITQIKDSFSFKHLIKCLL